MQRWGEPRETIDVDLTLLTGFGGEEAFVRKILERYDARIADAVDFALTRRVLLARPLWRRPGYRAGRIALSRSPRSHGPVCSPSSRKRCSAFVRLKILIVMKAFAARGKDWLDVEGIIVRQTGKLDWPYIRNQLHPLAELKEAPEIMAELEQRRLAFEQ